jgi:hypothetical protein
MRIVLAGLILLAAAVAARAQVLADRVPADAVIYVGFAGTDDPGPGYANSPTQKLLARSNFTALRTEWLPKVAQAIKDREGGDAEAFVLGVNTALDLLGPGSRKPSAFYLRAVQFRGSDMPVVRGGLVVRAGADSADLETRVKGLMAGAPEADDYVRVVREGDLLGLFFDTTAAGRDKPKASFDNLLSPGPTLAAAPAFTAALKQVDANAALTLYADAAAAIPTLEAALKSVGGRDAEAALPVVSRVLDAAGLRSLGVIVASGTFDATGLWSEKAFVALPAPRTGLPALFANADLDEPMLALLRRVPPNPGYVSWARFDAAKLLDTIRTMAVAGDPRAGDWMDQGLGVIQLYTARKLYEDLLVPLGDRWVSYSHAETGGNGQTGVVHLIQCDDPAAVRVTLQSYSLALTNSARPFLRQMGVEITPKTQKIRDGFVWTLPIPPAQGLPELSPTWAVVDGVLYLGDTEKAVLAAVSYKGNDVPASQSPAIKETLALSPVPNPMQVSRFDLTQTAPAVLAEAARALASPVVREVLPPELLPPNPLPPSDELVQLLGPAHIVTWADDAGFHTRAVMPVPGAQFLGNHLGALSQFSNTIQTSAGLIGAKMQDRLADPPPPANDRPSGPGGM